MTVFDDILNAEKEALQNIESVKNKTAELVATIRIEQKARITKEIESLHASGEVALKKYLSEIQEQTDSISADVKKQVEEVNKKFLEKANALKEEVIKNFSK